MNDAANIIEQFPVLRVARYVFCLQARETVSLPPFHGTTLRGAFGYALKAVACSMPHGDCDRCLLAQCCLFPTTFRPKPPPGASRLLRCQDAPRPFIFEPHFSFLVDDFTQNKLFRAGDELKFSLTLLGETTRVPYWIYAIALMAQHGFGVKRGSFVLREVFVLDENGAKTKIYEVPMTRVAEHENAVQPLGELVKARLAEINSIDAIRLRFHTPLRIRFKKELLENFDFATLVKQISLRLSMLSEMYGADLPDYDYQSLLAAAQKVKTKNERLYRLPLERYSGTRDEKLALDGVIGEAEYTGESLSEFLPWLAVGEILHVGSATVFGLGRYEILT